ncbi:hypothetical protein [Thiomicrorhabdus arctica]|jgi:hypothetical protein|uniref:hypothetical protein n=1 Tax=Thiomicrorhabdus arctica TaxID=131540 RepID=UPI0003622167|nr:hypothetical protein [Thiomicrorhabdus arctica]
MDRVTKSDKKDSQVITPKEIPVIETSKLPAMNTLFAYQPRTCINRYSQNRVNRPYSFLFESKHMVQNINQLKEEVILFGIMR